MRLAFVAVALLALACGAGSAARPKPISATISPRTATVELGRAWQVTIRLRRGGKPYAGARPTLTARRDNVTRSVRATGAGIAGMFRARLVLPRSGRWSYALSVRGTTLLRGALTVRARTAPPPPAADVQEPFGVALAANGDVLVADRAAHRVVRIDPVTAASAVVGGNGQPGFSGDGGPATAAAIDQPIDVAVARGGDLYIVSGNRVRRIAAATGVITTVAGTGERAFYGDGGPATAAALNAPDGLAFDSVGNLYLAEYENRVRRIDAASGVITTVAGTGAEASNGDGGPATQAAIMHPHGLAAAPDGTLYIADTWAHRIRRVDAATRIITTVAGTGAEGFAGDGGPATQAVFNDPINISLGPDGSLYVSDGSNNRVRRFQTGGSITTVAGNGIQVSRGDGSRATQASIAVPNQVAVAADGTFYITEFEGRAVRRVDGRSGIITTIAR